MSLCNLLVFWITLGQTYTNWDLKFSTNNAGYITVCWRWSITLVIKMFFNCNALCCNTINSKLNPFSINIINQPKFIIQSYSRVICNISNKINYRSQSAAIWLQERGSNATRCKQIRELCHPMTKDFYLQWKKTSFYLTQILFSIHKICNSGHAAIGNDRIEHQVNVNSHLIPVQLLTVKCLNLKI